MKNLTGLYPNLARACEIAMLGGFSINLYYSEEEYKNAHTDCKLLTNYYDNIDFIGFASTKNALKIELIRPNDPMDIISDRKFETIETIKSRVNKIQLENLPPNALDSTCSALLKTAYNRLAFTVTDVLNIIEVAKYIALLDSSKHIQTFHIAEAIQYNHITDGLKMY